ncbi:acyl-CoA dehydrogenase family protein [Cytobacillus purgationiresistens]|uniref:Alkylation response protein AidB-like acyl-CoA dehydrogenase n=1 Tax=Cytobacillus purgationiresistens TaxID=863449 RepID=A0ABU0AQB5_9BACI|nr:acyl-CoA dehydrogenase family protein [Cytobacillus purgationiresistens]MDQ0272962.1 alkylation response protein AidB-like acyl-CoA dehydrogenase [Cytobacillus purgationiresistens]
MSILDSLTKKELKDTNEVKDKVRILINKGYHLITFKKSFSCEEYSNFLMELASICSNTALSFSMHLYTVRGLWDLFSVEQQKRYEQEIRKGRIFGSINDPNVYFIDEKTINPNDYPVIVTKTQTGYLLNGIKHFVSLEPLVTHIPVYGLLIDEETDTKKIGIFIIDKNSNGVSTINNWDSISMPDTDSNSIELKNVKVPINQSIVTKTNIFSNTTWLSHLYKLSLSSVYLGMAKEIILELTKVKNKKVPHTNRSLAFFPGIQFSIAEILICYETAYSILEKYYRILDNPESNNQLKNRIGLITKINVSKSVEEIINKAMKIHGVKSLSLSNHLSKHYKDIKASIFHAPQQDLIYEMLAKDFLGILGTKNRWL